MAIKKLNNLINLLKIILIKNKLKICYNLINIKEQALTKLMKNYISLNLNNNLLMNLILLMDNF